MFCQNCPSIITFPCKIIWQQLAITTNNYVKLLLYTSQIKLVIMMIEIKVQDWGLRIGDWTVRSENLGIWICVGNGHQDWDWEMGIWDLGIGIGSGDWNLGLRIGDWNWRLGIWIGDWDQKLGLMMNRNFRLRLEIGDWDWGLENRILD